MPPVEDRPSRDVRAKACQGLGDVRLPGQTMRSMAESNAVPGGCRQRFGAHAVTEVGGQDRGRSEILWSCRIEMWLVALPAEGGYVTETRYNYSSPRISARPVMPGRRSKPLSSRASIAGKVIASPTAGPARNAIWTTAASMGSLG